MNPKLVKYVISAVALPMLAVFLVGLWMSHGLDEWGKSVWLDLAVTALGVLTTVLYVEQVLQKLEDQRIEGVRSVAAKQLNRVLATIPWTIANHAPLGTGQVQPFSVPFSRIRVDPIGWTWVLYENPAWIAYIRSDIMPNLKTTMESYSDDDVLTYGKSLEFAETKLREIGTMFLAILSPRQIELLTTLLAYFAEETVAVSYKIQQAPNQLPPYPMKVLEYCLALIEEDNRYLPNRGIAQDLDKLARPLE
jgi:hypothetical protein